MIFSYMYNILKFKKWEILCFVTILIALKWSTIITFRPNIIAQAELHKCPACFGTSACNLIYKVDVTLNNFNSLFSYFLGVKNVYFGSFNETKIVLKKLAQSFELNEFDRMIYKNDHFSRILTSNIKSRDNKIDIDFRKLMLEEISLNNTNENLNRLSLCPSAKNLNDLLEYVYRSNNNVDLKTLNINIWMSMVLNPEPLVLQILSADNGWPVPKYFGACGRLIIEEYVGLPLTTYYNKPWIIRAKIASSILYAIHLFTYKNEHFSFYLTDISADNIAIDINHNAKFVDLENVIIVDKSIIPLDKLETWKQLQVNTENFSCSECLAFSAAEICSHRISDHNYYAICKILFAFNKDNSIFPDGLLHDIPVNILKKYPDIQNLIHQCVVPEMSFDRIKIGMRLKELLDTILRHHG